MSLPRLIAFSLLTVRFFAPSLSTAQANAQATSLTAPNPATLIVAAALQALGGDAAFAKVADLTAIGSCSSVQRDGSTSVANVRWIVAGNEYLYESTQNGVRSAFISGHGVPWLAKADGTQMAMDAGSFRDPEPFFAPGLILHALSNDTTTKLTLVETKQIEGRTVSHVRATRQRSIVPSPADDQEWYFDSETNLPVELDFKTASVQSYNMFAMMVVRFAEPKSIGSVTVPMQIITKQNGSKRSKICTLTSVTENTSPASTLFDSSSSQTGGAQ